VCIFGFTKAAALAYSDIMSAAVQNGWAMTASDGMIAAIAGINGASLATRNLTDFARTGLELISPWFYISSTFSKSESQLAKP